MSQSYTVLFMDKDKDCRLFVSRLQELLGDGVTVVKVDHSNSREVADAIVEADAILTPLCSFNAEQLATMRRCRVIVKMGIGYDNIDAAAAAKLGIMVANIPDYCQGEVADHAMALFLACNRKIVLADNQVRKGIWNDGLLAPGTHRLAGRTFGLLGCGSIARATATRARAFGMECIGYDPYVDQETMQKSHIQKHDSLDAFLADADYISLHIPAVKENIGFINMEKLKLMKPGCILINTARGAVINEHDLYLALRDKVIAAAGIDVQVNEPPKQPSPFTELDNIVMTPHVGYYSVESDDALRVKGAEEIAAALTAGAPLHWVNRDGFVPR